MKMKVSEHNGMHFVSVVFVTNLFVTVFPRH